MSGHTPGPWEQKGHKIWAGRRHLATAHSWAEGQQANARLIAAAPDLLSSLIEMVNLSSKQFDHPRAMKARDKASAAIKKATEGTT